MTPRSRAAARFPPAWLYAAGALLGLAAAFALSPGGPGGDPGPGPFAAGARAAAHEPELSRFTYWREVRPLLERECGSCHSGGGPAPVNLMRYADALPWANSIARQVLERRMPPWLPEDGVGDFAHARTLDERETNLLVDWAIGLAPEGRPPETGEGDDAAAPGAPPADAFLLRAVEPVEVGEEISEEERCVPLEPNGDPPPARGFRFDPGEAAPILRRAVLLVGSCADGAPVFVWVVGQERRTGLDDLPPGFHRRLSGDGPFHLRLEYRKGFETEGLAFRHHPEVAVLPADAAASHAVETVAVASGSTRLRGDLLAIYPPEGLGAGGGEPGPEAFTVDAVGPDGASSPLLQIRRFDRDWLERFRLREALPLGAEREIRVSHPGAFLDLVRAPAPEAADPAESVR